MYTYHSHAPPAHTHTHAHTHSTHTRTHANTHTNSLTFSLAHTRSLAATWRFVRKVSVDETNTDFIDSVGLPLPLPPSPNAPRGPRGVGIPLHGGRSILEQVLLRPTFSQHFDTVVLDWRVVESATSDALAEQGRWAFRQNITVVVDFTSGLNLYPDLRLCNNSAVEFASSVSRIKSIIIKAAGTLVNASTASAATAAFSKDFIISLHRAPENDYTEAQCLSDFTKSVAGFAATASKLGATIHLRVGTDAKNPSDLVSARAFLIAAGSPPNLKLALGTAMLVGQV